MRWACYCMPSFTLPTFRTVMAASYYWRPCSADIPFLRRCSLTLVTRDDNSNRRWPTYSPPSPPRSSSVRIKPKDLCICPSVGLSSAPVRGSTAVEGLQRIGRTSIAKASPSCTSPQFASCCASFAIQPNVSGQTLRKHGNNNGLVLRDGHAAYILVEHV